MAVEFPQKSPTTVAELWQACQRAFWELKAASQGFVITGISVTTSTTAVAHGLRRAPSAVFFQTTGSSVGDLVTEVQPSDERFVYLKAGSDTTGSLLIIP